MASQAVARPTHTDAELEALAREAFARRRWDEILAAAEGVEFSAAGPRGRFFEAVSFALTQKKRLAEALGIARALAAEAPTQRRLVAWAYVAYAALLAGKEIPGTGREELKREFLGATDAVLRQNPSHVAALYRLGNFFAQVESARDRKALELFQRAVRVYEGLGEAARRKEHRFFKYYVKSLYGGARSAARLEEWPVAERLVGRCLRLDAATGHVAPVFVLYLAALVREGQGDPARAEKGLRLALEADGPPDRAFVHDRLARVRAAQGDLDGAVAWLDAHVPARRRPAWIWTHVGDLQLGRGDREAARRAWETALRGDRLGRHLVLCRLGELTLAEGKLGEARHRFDDARRQRRKVHQSDEPRALAGLAAVAEREGRTADAESLRAAAASPDRAPPPAKASLRLCHGG